MRYSIAKIGKMRKEGPWCFKMNLRLRNKSKSTHEVGKKQENANKRSRGSNMFNER